MNGGPKENRLCEGMWASGHRHAANSIAEITHTMQKDCATGLMAQSAFVELLNVAGLHHLTLGNLLRFRKRLRDRFLARQRR